MKAAVWLWYHLNTHIGTCGVCRSQSHLCHISCHPGLVQQLLRHAFFAHLLIVTGASVGCYLIVRCPTGRQMSGQISCRLRQKSFHISCIRRVRWTDARRHAGFVSACRRSDTECLTKLRYSKMTATRRKEVATSSLLSEAIRKQTMKRMSPVFTDIGWNKAFHKGELKGNVTHTGWRNVIFLSAVLNFLLPARGRWAPGLRTICPAQSSSSLCRTCLCFQRHIFTCRSEEVSAKGNHPRHAAHAALRCQRVKIHYSSQSGSTPLFIDTFLFSMAARLSSTLPASKQTAAPWGSLNAEEEEEEPGFLKEWTSEFKYYSDCILLLLVHPREHTPRNANNESWVSEAILRDVTLRVLTYSTSDKFDRVVVGEKNQPSCILVAFISAE